MYNTSNWFTHTFAHLYISLYITTIAAFVFLWSYLYTLISRITLFWRFCRHTQQQWCSCEQSTQHVTYFCRRRISTKHFINMYTHHNIETFVNVGNCRWHIFNTAIIIYRHISSSAHAQFFFVIFAVLQKHTACSCEQSTHYVTNSDGRGTKQSF